MTTLAILRNLKREMIQDRHTALDAAIIPRPDSPGIFDSNDEMWDHIERLFSPRLERIDRLIKKAEDRKRLGLPDPNVQAPALIQVQEGFSPGKK